jgi:hypothetical protein
MENMSIKDINIGCFVQVFSYSKLDLDIYKVLNIYTSKDDELIFKCNKMKFNEKMELVTTNKIDLIEGKCIMSAYNKISLK